MHEINDVNVTLCETILNLTKDKDTESVKKQLKSYDDTEVFLALSALRNRENEKIDIICADCLLNGIGCKKSETEAGKLFSRIVSYLEKRNTFPPEYSLACYKAAQLLYDKANAFELNLGFAIDYDRRGSINGGSTECQKRYETNIEFLKNIIPGKYENEEMLYKVAAFVLSDQDKKTVLDKYWNTLKEKAEKTQKAFFLKYFSPDTPPETLLDADKIIKQNHSFPDGCELYQKEEAKRTRPSVTAAGTKKSEFFSKVSIAYHEYDKAISELFKTRAACERKVKYSEKLGTHSFEFWCNEEKVSRALEVLKRQETYENVFGNKPSEFWENDAVFFKYIDALSRKEQYENILGANDWDFWLSTEKVKKALSDFNEKQSVKLKKEEKNKKVRKLFKKIIISLACFVVLYIVFSFVLNFMIKTPFLSFLTAFFLSLIGSFILVINKKE